MIIVAFLAGLWALLVGLDCADYWWTRWKLKQKDRLPVDDN